MMTNPDDLFYRCALALSLGLIIGFQRERKSSTLAGIRTFPFISLMGFFSASMEKAGLSWTVSIGLLATALVISRGMTLSAADQKQSGITTEIAGLFVFLLGAAFRILDSTALVVVAGGVGALLLHLKETMHGWVEKLNRKEVRAIMQFVLIAFVILPLLPDETYDNFNVINPRKIWLMVVLITGISLVSFSVQKVVGHKAGSLWTGILGGLVSSTATTVTLSRVSAVRPTNTFLVPAILIASTAAFIRILVEILVVTPKTFFALALPLGALFVFMAGLSALSFFRGHENPTISEVEELSNPSQLKAALIFGFLFGGVLYLSSWVRAEYGQAGSFVVSLISGLIDVDAITLSTAHLIETGEVKSNEGWRLIMTAFLSNLGFKLAMVLVLARGAVRKQVTFLFLASLAAGILLMWLWPS